MRGKGINYDTGFSPGGVSSREQFDASIVRREMQVIADDLHCSAVRISGGEPARLSVAAELAAAAGLEVWFAPFPCELAAGLQAGGEQLHSAFAALPGKLNGFLAATAEDARGRFGGPLSYASGMWEPVDWTPFDVVGVDAYRDAGNAGRFRLDLRQQLRHAKPLAVTEFSCCGYPGAADRGGLGWAILDTSAEPPVLDGDYVRDEHEQVTYLRELTEIFETEGVDLAFWFTFAGYDFISGTGSRRDLDLASYGVVKMIPGGPGSGYRDLGWEPKLPFRALAQAG
jgi:hypothetical protein